MNFLNHIFLLLLLSLTACQNSLQPLNNRTSFQRLPLIEQNKLKTVLKASNDLFTDLILIRYQLANQNLRFAELMNKSKSSTLSASEAKEMKDMIGSKMADLYGSKLKKSNKIKDYSILIFDIPYHPAFKSSLFLLREIAEEYGIGLTIIPPQDFQNYVKRNKIQEGIIVDQLSKLYSQSPSIERLDREGQFPILIHSPHTHEIFYLQKNLSIKDKKELKAEILVRVYVISSSHL